MMEHATQFPEEYSKMVGVQRKVRPHACGGCGPAAARQTQHPVVAAARPQRTALTRQSTHQTFTAPTTTAPPPPKVDEVKNIMSENIEKVLNRGEKLDMLVDKTDNLMFEVRAGRVAEAGLFFGVYVFLGGGGG